MARLTLGPPSAFFSTDRLRATTTAALCGPDPVISVKLSGRYNEMLRELTNVPPKRIVAVLSDLMFTVKIQEAARSAGLEATFVKTAETAFEKAKERPAVLIIDLNSADFDALQLIERLKSDVETSSVRLVGFISHVQADRKRAAQERGCDVVIARSAFSHKLPALLKQYAGTG